MLKGSAGITEGMVETISLWDRARALGDTVRNAFAPVPADDAAFGSFGLDNNLTDEMRSTIAARIDEGRQNAQDLGEAFSIEHYRQACVAFGENNPEGQRMVAEGKWSPASYADLSGQNLQGIRLTNPQAIKPAHELSPAIQADYDSFDRDGDGKINSPAVNQFYDRVTFDKGTDLRNAIVDPATSFNKEIASAGNLDSLTINNMVDGDRFEFGAGTYPNIKMDKINGGEIVFGDGSGQISRVEILEIRGTKASITMRENAIVNNINTSDRFRVVDLSMARGASLSGDLSNATISMASEFESGSIFQDLKLGENVKGIDLSGVNLRNVTIDGFPIQRPSDLAQFGISYDNTTLASVSPEMARNYELAQIRETMQGAIASIGSGSPAAPATSQTAKVIDPLAETNPHDTLAGLARIQAETLAAVTNLANGAVKDLAPTQISGAQHVASLSEALAGGYNPAKDMVARVQPETSMTMTMPGSNA